jgi:hypothetical protein
MRAHAFLTCKRQRISQEKSVIEAYFQYFKPLKPRQFAQCKAN